MKILSKMKCRREILMKKRIDLNLESMSLTTMARMNIDGYKPKYTWKGHASYYFWGLNEIKSYFKQNNSSLFKTYANFSWFKAIAMWASGMSNHRKKRSILIISRFHIFVFILKRKKRKRNHIQLDNSVKTNKLWRFSSETLCPIGYKFI